MERRTVEDLSERPVATNPKVDRKGATIPYTSLNGRRFSMLTQTNQVALRLPLAERTAVLRTYRTTRCEQYGVVQTECVMGPDARLAKAAELKRHFDVSYACVAAMKPEATTTKPGRATRPARAASRKPS